MIFVPGHGMVKRVGQACLTFESLGAIESRFHALLTMLGQSLGSCRICLASLALPKGACFFSLRTLLGFDKQLPKSGRLLSSSLFKSPPVTTDPSPSAIVGPEAWGGQALGCFSLFCYPPQDKPVLIVQGPS